MQPSWVRLRQAGQTRCAAAHTLDVLRPRGGRPVAVDLFDREPECPGAFPVDARTLHDGQGAATFVAVLYRRADIDHAEFSRYWRDEHARFGALIPLARSYVQLHAHEDAPVDGVCLVGFDTVADLTAGLHDEVIAGDARADETHFIDHSRSYGLVCGAC